MYIISYQKTVREANVGMSFFPRQTKIQVVLQLIRVGLINQSIKFRSDSLKAKYEAARQRWKLHKLSTTDQVMIFHLVDTSQLPKPNF